MPAENQYLLTDNTEQSQYEFHIDGEIPRIEYRKKNNTIYLVHTEVPIALGGRGIGQAIVEAALKDIESKQLRLVVLCPYVAAYIKRHPDWNRLIG